MWQRCISWLRAEYHICLVGSDSHDLPARGKDKVSLTSTFSPCNLGLPEVTAGPRNTPSSPQDILHSPSQHVSRARRQHPAVPDHRGECPAYEHTTGRLDHHPYTCRWASCTLRKARHLPLPPSMSDTDNSPRPDDRREVNWNEWQRKS
ncbi:hypothetical protein E2C01_064372 [Portunus trituberculatus]|uniref:Uncharacterized protein n=1 Tax=Portunus trituberculatus TaxID=210409 RepID=A0A5B7HIW3_PORTR|nr:hypothetical protein [Portunus trituberculatus]